MTDPERAAAVRLLQDALGMYESYRQAVDRGGIYVNARDDPEDLVVAAERHVEDCIHACRSLGMSDAEIEREIAQ